MSFFGMLGVNGLTRDTFCKNSITAEAESIFLLSRLYRSTSINSYSTLSRDVVANFFLGEGVYKLQLAA